MVVTRGIWSVGSFLQLKSQRYLQLSWIPDYAANHWRLRVPDRAVWLSELRSVEGVKGFGAKLQFHFLVDRKILEERRVEINAAWSEKNIAAGAPIGEWRRGRESGAVEPIVQ